MDLQPAAREPEYADELLVGDWAAALPAMLLSEQVPPWCSYAARVDGKLVGYGGFKGKPGPTGAVEIGYLTFVSERGRGWAKEICAGLVKIAFEHQAVAVIAHTQPETDASTAVLRAQSFDFLGEVNDPSDGLVWRWEKRQAFS